MLPGRGHLGPPGRRSRRGGGSSLEFVLTKLGLRPGDVVALGTGVPRRNCRRGRVTNAERRCLIVQPDFFVVVNDERYPELVTKVRENGTFNKQMEGGANAGATWSIRLRRYVPAAGGTDDVMPAPHARYGKPGRGRIATRDEAEGSGVTRSSEEKE